MPKNSIKISDTTFRDAHQSLLATRMRTEDFVPIAEKMDSAGFYSMEVWGGATFDAATRFLAEDPWERLRTFKKLIKKTPLTMLLRGQSLVGYRTYADDLVDKFVERSAENGIDIFRVFDALNQEVNLERAARAVKRQGKHLQLAICYSVTENGRLGGPIFDLEYFLSRAKRFEEMGADSICLKDMGGVLAPYDAFELIQALKSTVDVPIQLHTHATSGMAMMTVLKAIEAGVDIIDTCLAPLGLRTSQPAIEPLLVALGNTERDPELDLELMLEMGDHLESILPKYRDLMESPRAAVIDARVLKHQIPGGMLSNLVSQLREADAIDRLDEVLEEIPRTRKELGYPPLVTPMSQMIGSQSVSNVLFGRYQMISDQVKDFVYGLYGQPPVPAQPDIVQMVLEDYERGQEPVSGRPADHIEPELASAKDAVKDITSDIDDILVYALYPTTGMRFLRIKHGLDPMPDEMKPLVLVDKKVKEETAEPPSEQAQPVEIPHKSGRVRQFNVFVDGEFFQVDVDPIQAYAPPIAPPLAPPPTATPAIVPPAPKPPVVQTRPATPAPQSAPPPAVEASDNDTEIKAPMPGIVLRYLVQTGQNVSKGDPVLVLEAMKMENTLPAPVDGTIKALPVETGTTIARGAVLAVITT